MALILVTNDDGVFSSGIKLLAEELARIAEVVIVAPDREQSASSHALTLHRPLRLQKLEENCYAVDGTPTDCVSLGVLSLLAERTPDLVVSGINFGSNLGDDVTYSGTVSATFEGSLLGIPSLAFSQEVGEGFDFRRGARFASRLAAAVLALPERRGMLLNVNFPAGPFRGVRLTRLGRREYKQSIVEKVDPRGRKYYWIAGYPEWEGSEGTDQHAVAAGYVAVTPLHLDLTDYPGIERMQGLLGGLEALTAGLEEA